MDGPKGLGVQSSTLLSSRHRNKVSTLGSSPQPGNPLWESVHEDHRKRLIRYAKARRRSRSMAEWLRTNGPNDPATATRARAIGDCGSYLVFRKLLAKDETHLHAASFCRSHLLCPFCAIRRAAKYVGAYADRLVHYATAHRYERVLFVTLTVADGPDLAERFKHLHEAVRSLMARRRKSRSKSSRNVSSMQCVQGGVGAYEIKRGRNSGEWHPHYHGIWICNSKLDFASFQQEWEEITKDSKFVHVKHLDEWMAFAGGLMTFDEYSDALPRAFVEVFKYPLKFSDLSYADNWASFVTLKGRRLVAGFGCLRGVKVEETLTDSAVDWDSEEFIELCYLFVGGEYSQVSSQECRRERSAVIERGAL